MTIQYVRCTSGDEDVIVFDVRPDHTTVLLHPCPDGGLADHPEAQAGIPLAMIPHAEAIALGHMLVAIASAKL